MDRKSVALSLLDESVVMKVSKSRFFAMEQDLGMRQSHVSRRMPLTVSSLNGLSIAALFIRSLWELILNANHALAFCLKKYHPTEADCCDSASTGRFSKFLSPRVHGWSQSRVVIVFGI